MDLLTLETPEAVLAWALFREQEPDNLGEPDELQWHDDLLPRAVRILQECAAHGYRLER